MAKQVVLQWVEIRYLEIPDKCPTDSYEKMMNWLNERSLSTHLLKKEVRDLKIVEVEE